MLVLGVRDYARKCGFSSVLLGLSGGIDSALVAVQSALKKWLNVCLGNSNSTKEVFLGLLETEKGERDGEDAFCVSGEGVCCF